MSVHLGNIFGDVWDAVTSVADDIVDAAHVIPGVDWAGDQMKDFAGSTVGKIALTAFTSGLYQAGEGTLAAYTALAPQVASLAFAFPGLMAGDSFLKAYLSELTLRIKQTAETVSPEAGEALSSAIEPALKTILSNPSIQTLIAQGTSDLQGVTKKLVDAGVANVTDYATQKALDLMHKTNDAAQMFFDTLGNQTDAAGNRILGQDADAAALAKMRSLNMSTGVYQAALRTQRRTTTQMARSSFVDELDAARAAAPIVVTTSAPAGVTKKQLAIGGGATLLLAFLIVEYL